jgi:2-oxoacid dehydrogenase/acyltransferase catalytic subunit
MSTAIDHLIRPQWGPLRDIERGWQALTADEQASVTERVEQALAGLSWRAGDHKDALGHFFTFLAQVETIAIEVPLRFLPDADAAIRPALRRQLADEVFHSVLFARIAHELHLPHAQPPSPLASAEALLARIRNEPDLAISATLLNLVSEGWIEELFEHAMRWGITDSVFAAVLRDEARHVSEAEIYITAVDPARTEAVLADFEDSLVAVLDEPVLALSIYDLAGFDGYRALLAGLLAKHRQQLAAHGLRPSRRWVDLDGRTSTALELHRVNHDRIAEAAPVRVEDTQWRRAARRIWATPTNPTMRGGFDVPVGHIPKKLLTPILIAAVGRAWATEAGRSLNRVLARDGIWQLQHIHVGVRVLVGDEIATIVITSADERSVADVAKMLAKGYQALVDMRANASPTDRNLGDVSEGLAELVPASSRCSVTISNVGKFGLTAGSGALSPYSPTTDITVGERRKLPVWRFVTYLPAWHVHLGCLLDHRVVDGQDAGLGMRLIRDQLTRPAIRALLAAEDTIPGAIHDHQIGGALGIAPAFSQLLATSSLVGGSLLAMVGPAKIPRLT